jgi:hypothetical protein
MKITGVGGRVELEVTRVPPKTIEELCTLVRIAADFLEEHKCDLCEDVRAAALLIEKVSQDRVPITAHVAAWSLIQPRRLHVELDADPISNYSVEGVTSDVRTPGFFRPDSTRLELTLIVDEEFDAPIENPRDYYG